MSASDPTWDRLAGAHPDRIVGRRIVVLDESPSTNDAAREIVAAEGEWAHGVFFVAKRQTAGRGTRGRKWWSPPGSSLAISVILAPRPALARPAGFTLAAALAVVDAGIAHGARLLWKWPNDVVDPKGAKVCGVLAETIPGPVPIHVLGVGVNVLESAEPPPPDVMGTIASLASSGCWLRSPAEFVPPFLDHLEAEVELFAEHGTAAIASRCNGRSFLAGRAVRMRRGQAVADGRFAGLGPDLAVKLVLSDGSSLEWPGEQVELLAPR